MKIQDIFILFISFLVLVLTQYSYPDNTLSILAGIGATALMIQTLVKYRDDYAVTN